MEARVGDIICFSSLMPHRTGPNVTEEIRKAYEAEHGPAPPATLAQVADHIEHVARVAGHDHVGIGSDYYGGPMPEGLEDVGRFPHLVAELVRRGWSDENLAKRVGGNVLRVLGAAEEVALRLQRVSRRAPS